MTTHTRADLDRLSSLARREFSHAHMSDTKWRKLFTAMDEAGVDLEQMIVKFIDVPEPKVMYFPSINALYQPYPWIDSFDFGPIELRSIEWMDIPAVARFPRLNNVPALETAQNLAAAEAVLLHLNCNFAATPGGLRVIGYSR
ncbi:DUF6678 family protein [Bosea sp. (in: a-proteobacteria)]|uniref:DUF6678 family protein n=1 Tax=Bosea sp. (in: a-proteobacteria) TaxID=1871050 RepID=UPI00341BAFA5